MLASEANDAVVLQKKDEFTVQLTRERNGIKEARSFNFDSVFDLRSTQQEVFTDCTDIVQSALDGYNARLFLIRSQNEFFSDSNFLLAFVLICSNSKSSNSVKSF